MVEVIADGEGRGDRPLDLSQRKPVGQAASLSALPLYAKPNPRIRP